MPISLRVRSRLSAYTIRGAILSIRFASALKSISFEIQSDAAGKQNLYVRSFKTRSKRTLYYFVTAYSILYTIFQCAGFAINLFQHGFTTENATHSLIVIRTILSTTFVINSFFKADGIVWEINQLCSMMETVGMHQRWL